MRLIDVDALRADYGFAELCTDCPIYGKKECESPMYSLKQFCWWLDDAPTVATDTNVPGKWISVGDRLPEKNGDYLAYTRDGIVWPYFFTASSGVWEDTLGYSTDTVTHWMPLPAPPKEENE